MDIKDFLQEYHPEILSEYERYLRKDILPKVGSTVKTLRSGFGGGVGITRKVVELTEDGIILAHSNIDGGGRYLSKTNNWWKDLEVISE